MYIARAKNRTIYGCYDASEIAVTRASSISPPQSPIKRRRLYRQRKITQRGGDCAHEAEHTGALLHHNSPALRMCVHVRVQIFPTSMCHLIFLKF